MTHPSNAQQHPTHSSSISYRPHNNYNRLLHPSPHNMNKQASNSNKQQARHKRKSAPAQALASKSRVGLTQWCPPWNPVFGSRLPHRGGPNRGGYPPKRGRTGQKGPRPRPRDLGLGPRHSVTNWACTARSWGTAAPRCAPSDACLGHFGRNRAGSVVKLKNGRIAGWTARIAIPRALFPCATPTTTTTTTFGGFHPLNMAQTHA